jgi:tetratricopeptide (TPR) repeat protein
VSVNDDSASGETVPTAGENSARSPTPDSVTAKEVRILVSRLGSAGRPGRLAAQMLAAAGAEAVPALIEVLNSGGRVARENAAWALGRIGAAAASAVPFLNRALRDDHPWVQEKAAEALATIERASGGRPVVADETSEDERPVSRTPERRPASQTIPLGMIKRRGLPSSMKTIRNEKHGFEIDVPVEWVPAPSLPLKALGFLSAPKAAAGASKDSWQYGCVDEAFNFVIGPLFPVPPLEDTELEFTLYAQNREYTELEFGRITVGGKDHVWARYHIHDRLGKRWNKKYMLVFGVTEYSITATCNDPLWFARRERDWDAIVSSFRLLAPVDDVAASVPGALAYQGKKRELLESLLLRREITGTLYGRAYEAVAAGQYSTARRLLEQCLQERPDHTLAHKEMAVVLKKLGNMQGACRHRREVKRLAPSDTVNRVNLAELLAGLGRKHQALQEADELLALEPDNARFQALRDSLGDRRRPNYQVTFFSGLAVLLGTEVGLWLGWLGVKDTLCMGLLMLLPTFAIYISGPWVGIPSRPSALLAAVLFLSFVATLLLKG